MTLAGNGRNTPDFSLLDPTATAGRYTGTVESPGTGLMVPGRG